jgi:hypothetical protein
MPVGGVIYQSELMSASRASGPAPQPSSGSPGIGKFLIGSGLADLRDADGGRCWYGSDVIVAVSTTARSLQRRAMLALPSSLTDPAIRQLPTVTRAFRSDDGAAPVSAGRSPAPAYPPMGAPTRRTHGGSAGSDSGGDRDRGHNERVSLAALVAVNPGLTRANRLVT